ncbi:MAG: N-acetyltransferase [Clostridiales bacterium]|nr:N-acetyltransferase [Clostridiales bacterium]
MKFEVENDRIYSVNDGGDVVAEVNFPATGEGVVDINRTWVDDSLRGQGVAGLLMEECYAVLKADGRKAVPSCSYAVKWYEDRPERNDVVAAGGSE